MADHLPPSAAPAAAPTPSAPAPSAPAPSAAPAPTAAPPTPVATGTPTPSPEPSAPPSTEPQRFKIRVDGKDLDVDLEEMKRGYIGGATWTQRSQALAEERRRFQSEVDAFQARQQAMRGDLEQLQTMLQNPQALRQYLSILEASNGQQVTPGSGLDVPLTKAEFEVALQRREQALRSQFEKALSSMQTQFSEMSRHREVGQHTLAFDRYLEKFLDENKGLDELYDRAELMAAIKQEAGQRVAFQAQTNPQDVRDWQEFSLRELEAAAKRRLERVSPYLANRTKLEAIGTPAAPNVGMVPPVPGAPGPMPQPKAALKLGSKEMLNAVNEFVSNGGQTS